MTLLGSTDLVNRASAPIYALYPILSTLPEIDFEHMPINTLSSTIVYAPNNVPGDKKQ